jgi:hypothetical protein
MKRAFLLAALVLAGCSSDGAKKEEPSAPAAEEKPATPAEHAAAPPAPAAEKPEPLPVYELVYLGGSPQAAVIRVRKKFEKGWLEKKYVVMPKNPDRNWTGAIGRVEHERDPWLGEDADMDYGTGCVLLEIVKDTIKDKSGEHPRMRLHYTDAGGAPHDLWMDQSGPKKE